MFHPPLRCNGSAWKRVVRTGDMVEHVYDSGDDSNFSTSVVMMIVSSDSHNSNLRTCI